MDEPAASRYPTTAPRAATERPQAREDAGSFTACRRCVRLTKRFAPQYLAQKNTYRRMNGSTVPRNGVVA
jgi:hypothetical protein